MQIKFSLFMYKIIDIIVLYIPVGVFGLMTNAMATYIDQIHTATNATGDIVVATCVSVTEGTLECTAQAYIDEVKK